MGETDSWSSERGTIAGLATAVALQRRGHRGHRHRGSATDTSSRRARHQHLAQRAWPRLMRSASGTPCASAGGRVTAGAVRLARRQHGCAIPPPKGWSKPSARPLVVIRRLCIDQGAYRPRSPSGTATQPGCPPLELVTYYRRLSRLALSNSYHARSRPRQFGAYGTRFDRRPRTSNGAPGRPHTSSYTAWRGGGRLRHRTQTSPVKCWARAIDVRPRTPLGGGSHVLVRHRCVAGRRTRVTACVNCAI